MLATLLAIGCSSDDPKPPDRTLSRREFIELGDQACRRSLDRREEIVQRVRDGRLPEPETMQRSSRLLLRYLDRLEPAYADLLEYFQALRPPPDGREFAQGLIVALEAQIDQINQAQRFAEQGKPGAYSRTPGQLEQRQGFLRLGNRMQAYGFSVCGLEPFEGP
jgi:hypothetical protein